MAAVDDAGAGPAAAGPPVGVSLREEFRNPGVAWERFLEFSPGSREALASQEMLASAARHPAALLEPRSTGKYRIEWKEAAARADAPSRRLAALREWQKTELVRLAFMDFATLPPAAESSARYTSLAEFVLGAALDLAREKAPDADQDQTHGFSILALGKLGAADLNFFSDLDLIFLAGEGDDGEACTRLARAFVTDLDAKGGELIYRVDLRLRPEGDRGPLVCTQEGLEDYYGAYGEIWERCAWIRGRRVAGDQETAYEVFQSLQGFVYPRGLTPSSLGELFEQKSRAEEELISAADKEREIKRGRGGLREVEFPVLGLQLLHGATQPTLQTHDLRKAIRNLKILGILKAEEEQVLLGGYDFWRRLEDFLQMRQIRQTHLLPSDPGDLDLVARALGRKSGAELEKEVELWRGIVRGVYDSISGELRPKGVSVGGWPEKLTWQDPWAARSAWEGLAPSGEVHATTRTRENFQRLQPALEKRLAGSSRPDLALAGFANFVQGYGARSLLYETLCVSPKALDLLIRFFESSRFLGPGLVARPELFEEVTQSDLDNPRTVAAFRKAWKLPKDPEEALDGTRSFVRGEELRIALRGLLGLAEIPVLQGELTALADACLGWAWEFSGKGKWAWIGLGKLGGNALSFGSDLDLLVAGEGEEAVQKAVKFLTEERASGALFKVDFRLRPYAEGALAVPVKRYGDYYGQEAQAWEVQTLCRARPIAGAKEPMKNFWPVVEKRWKQLGSDGKFVEEMVAMRERIATERVPPGEEERAYKTRRGGLIDVEFAAQAWQMRKGLVETDTAEVLQAMARTEKAAAQALQAGLIFWSTAEWWLRLDEGRGGSLLPKPGPDLDWLARQCGFMERRSWDEAVRRTLVRTQQAYEQVTGNLVRSSGTGVGKEGSAR
jgi:glutamate-ammonia-ligase adenylyltransferase